MPSFLFFLNSYVVRILVVLVALSAYTVRANSQENGKVNVYTTREPKLVQPLLEAFTRQHGIAVNLAFFKDGMVERVKAEGTNSPADILMTVDIATMIDLVNQNLTQAIESEVLKKSIPENLRDKEGHWYVMSLRDRVVYASKDLKLKEIHYEDLAKPEWRDKVCIRSGQHPYNIALISAMIAHNGKEKTEEWLVGIKKNLARKPTGGDRDVARDILGGLCDIGIANSYYAGQMKSSPSGSEARKWGNAISVVRPTFEKSGTTFVNISGASVARFSPNKDNAIKLMDFLLSDEAQVIYAKINFEYPVKLGVAVDELMSSFGPLNPDTLSLIEVAKNRKIANDLVEKVGFDQ